MNAHEHIGDEAALYALGMLGDDERHTVEERARGCDGCARLLAAAEDDVTTLVDAQTARDENVVELRPVRSRAPVWRPVVAAAVAAALIAGIVPATYLLQEDAAMHRAMATGAAAMNRVASTPHREVAFDAMPGGGTEAHVMYGRDGSWYVVLVRGATHALSVTWMHDGQQTMLGTAQLYGDVALLYLPKSHRMDRLGLLDGDRVVAEANLAY